MVEIGIIMGSKSDYPVMKEATEILDDFGIGYETEIVSAHRTPEKMMDYSKNAHKRGIKVIIAGAGGAAHLPGMVASNSPLPVIGVPISLGIQLMVGIRSFQYYKCLVEFPLRQLL